MNASLFYGPDPAARKPALKGPAGWPILEAMQQEIPVPSATPSVQTPEPPTEGAAGARPGDAPEGADWGVCGVPSLIPGWIYEPAELLAQMARFEARQAEVAVATRDATPALPGHLGAGEMVLALTVAAGIVRAVRSRLSRRAQRRADRRDRTERRASGRERLSLSLRYILIRSIPRGILPLALRRRVDASRRELGARKMALTAEASGLTPEQVHAWALERMARERAQEEAAPSPKGITVHRGRRNPNARPVTVPPHVAQMMARMRAARSQADAHATYVRAERGPQVAGATAIPDARASSIQQAIARARARSGLQHNADGTKSWVVDD